MTSTGTRDIRLHQITWRGLTIEIEFEAAWLGSESIGGMRVAHLQLRTIEPARAPMPVSETGYRSHFVDRDEVAEAGGPTAYALGWLDREARSAAWRAREAAASQLTLF